jgi:hypothetical protein
MGGSTNGVGETPRRGDDTDRRVGRLRPPAGPLVWRHGREAVPSELAPSLDAVKRTGPGAARRTVSASRESTRCPGLGVRGSWRSGDGTTALATVGWLDSDPMASATVRPARWTAAAGSGSMISGSAPKPGREPIGETSRPELAPFRSRTAVNGSASGRNEWR